MFSKTLEIYPQSFVKVSKGALQKHTLTQVASIVVVNTVANFYLHWFLSQQTVHNSGLRAAAVKDAVRITVHS